MPSNACTRSSGVASRRRPCCRQPRPPRCCSGPCSRRARSPCARSTDGKASPSSPPARSQLTSQPDPTTVHHAGAVIQAFSTQIATAPPEAAWDRIWERLIVSSLPPDHRRMKNFRPVDRDTGFLMPPSVDEWLPERHLARFVVDVIASLDLRAMIGSYRGCGEASYHPAVLLGILVYGYATGVFSSRKLERASYDSVAFRFVAANQHPDHDTIAAFRRRFLKQIEELFVQVLMLAREMGVLTMGTIALDGTKIHANASRHSALSHEYAGKLEAQLQAEVAELMARAEAADQADLPDGMSIPDELARRQQRLAEIARARAIIEARAKERHAREQADYEAKMAARVAKAAAVLHGSVVWTP